MSEPSVLRAGRISFANVDPLFHGFERHRPNWLECFPGVPEELNRQLLAGDLDLTFASSILLSQGHVPLQRVGNWGIARKGAVGSILLGSRCPPENSQGKWTRFSPHSATSNMLLRILDRELGWGMEFTTERTVLVEGELFIGNFAFGPLPWPHVTDLGKVWFDRFGEPMVYAVLVARGTFLNKAERLVSLFTDGLAQGLANHREEKIEEKYGPLYGLPPQFLADYYSLFTYRLGEAEERGLSRFLEMAGAML